MKILAIFAVSEDFVIKEFLIFALTFFYYFNLDSKTGRRIDSIIARE